MVYPVDNKAMRRASADEIGGLFRLPGAASEGAVAVATRVLAYDVANARWRSQIGPCLTQAATADLLGLTPQGVAKRASTSDLLRLVNGDGRPAYPLFQFAGRRVRPSSRSSARLAPEMGSGLSVISAPMR